VRIAAFGALVQRTRIHPEKRKRVANPVVHFEIIGSEPEALRGYYGELFGWDFDTSGPVADEVSEPGDYGFIDPGDNGGIPGGIGGGPTFEPRTVFYVGVDNVEAALARAEELGGTRVSGPHSKPDSPLRVGFFTDPEGNVVGVAGIA
jgi:predicted enzyme related to lactoylglutathione lyase